MVWTQCCPGTRHGYNITPVAHYAFAALLGPRAPSLRRTRVIRSETEEPMLAGVKGPTNVEAEGLPWWWEYFWKLPITQRGNPGDPLNMGDTMHVFRGNIEQIYGDFPSVDGAPLTCAL